jgi:phage terminase small subunit|tara:strand:+ start:376 stop:852 length:477 start_codon:yes stop_codon:yes gene_type:complete
MTEQDKAMRKKVKLLKKSDPSEYDVNENFLQFVAYYVESGSAREAWVQAGYSPNSAGSAMSRLRDNWRLVESMVKERIGAHVPMALSGIIELAQSAKQESIRLKAQQDILYRAGYDKPMEMIVTDKDAKDLKDDELQKELLAILGKNHTIDVKAEEIH